jgi:glutamate N-acetyltransferase/amino-acid N-acetyltransferase
MDRLDLCLIVADKPCNAAGVFTTNDVKAAPVRYSQNILLLTQGKIRGVVANSGNANACTSQQGDIDAQQMAEISAKVVGTPDEAFLVCSTGRIGELLPMIKVAQGITAASKNLSNKASEGRRAAESILTSDTET